MSKVNVTWDFHSGAGEDFSLVGCYTISTVVTSISEECSAHKMLVTTYWPTQFNILERLNFQNKCRQPLAGKYVETSGIWFDNWHKHNQILCMCCMSPFSL